MTDKVLKAGVIGVGAGMAHARGYTESDGVELVALCDIDAARIAQRGADYPDVKHYTDYKVMFEQADLDVVSVCLPNSLHPLVAIDALEAGLHVVCEKPLSADLAGSERIANAVAIASGKFTVCYNKRYRADSAWIKQAVNDGVLGELYQVEAKWTRETGIPGGWFSQKSAAGGGPLIDLGVHVLDLAMWMLGFPTINTVSGVTRAVFGPEGRKSWNSKSGDGSVYDVEDGAVGFLRLGKKNVPLLLEASWADHRRPGEDDIFLRVAGSKGSAVMHVKNYTQQDTVRMYTEVNGSPVEVRPDLKPPKHGGHSGLIHAFVQSILQDTAPPAPVAEGMATIRVLDALYRSSTEGREITLV